MYSHLMYIYKSNKLKKRFAFHKICNNIIEMKDFIKMKKILNDRFKDLDFIFHQLNLEQKNPQKIGEYDAFFRNIEYYSDIEEFCEIIRLSKLEEEILDLKAGEFFVLKHKNIRETKNLKNDLKNNLKSKINKRLVNNKDNYCKIDF